MRLAVWILVALLPVTLAGIYVFDRIEDELSSRVAADLEGLRELEVARIDNALSQYEDRAQSLAYGPHVREFTAQVVQSRSDGFQSGAIGGYDGFELIDAFDETPLQALAGAMKRKAEATTSERISLQLTAVDGSVLGQTAGFDWTPADPTLVQSAIDLRGPVFGDAFRDSQGESRVGMAVPIVGPDETVVGLLMLENPLGPISDLFAVHEGFGDESEAHLAQRTTNGEIQFITPLRFEDDAAFNKVMSGEQDMPINRAFDAPDGELIFAPDYRNEDSILAVQTIEQTGWALVIKMDEADAFDPVLSKIRVLKVVGLLALVGLLLGWAVFLDPIGRRLRRMAEAAKRVSDGEYDRPLDDRSTDEIGTMARSIDRLATDLATDIAVRRDVEGRLRHQATHDATTGLYNRQYAASQMKQLVAASGDEGRRTPFSLLFLDLDNFKSVNDVYGHATGDAVLKITGERVAEAVGDRGEVARWGGDEFVVVLDGTSAGAAQDVATDVQRALLAPITTDAGSHQVRVSIGVSTLANDESLEQVLQLADEAMFAQKQSRSGRQSVSPSSVRAVEYALQHDAVDVLFQPLVAQNGTSVELRGVEALVRIRDEYGVSVSPGDFLGDVERSYVGRDLDRRVLAVALEQVGEWVRSGLLPNDFQVSVNCSEALLRDPDTSRYVNATLVACGLEPHNLMLELSEKSSIMQPEVLDQLWRLGVTVAIDDLGLQNSNVDRLLDSGASVVKIDRRWLTSRSDGETRTNMVVLSHLVSLSDALGLSVIAAGVETPEQYQLLRDLGVEMFQGYLFSRPVSAEELEHAYLS